MTIKERIKDICKQKNIPVYLLEEECGLAKGYISKLDKSNPTADKLYLICSYLNISMDYLITGHEGTESLSSDSQLLLSFFNSMDQKKRDQLLLQARVLLHSSEEL